ncbi:SRPBCC family protein [Phenylobacterium sp.]|jgi:uncharacterized protein YndB with AHSA1/START domain|uniref:SRPBCC family protein n=1 Tax=Phenylobacterium sp. TaxID=1871053 RepID=UPI002F94424A
MTKRSVTHAVFSLERTYDAPPARVWAAFATDSGKASWFSGPEDNWTPLERAFDFREGGRERARGKFHNGPVSDFRAHYHEIVEGQRIVFAYDMFIDDVRISVSLQTVELEPAGEGTRVKLTEQGAYLDGYDDAGARERGTAGLLDQLGVALERAPAEA